jgi:hypothetical protein
VFAHNPADLALAHAIQVLKIPLDRIVMLSISTGHVNHHVTTESSNDANFGYYQWYSHMSHVLWNGMVEKSSTICAALLNERFHRVSLTLPRDFPLDQPEAMPEMIQLGKGALRAPLNPLLSGLVLGGGYS